MTIENGHIKFPVAKQGHSAMAILDSGAQINAINQNFIDFNKLDVVTGKKVMIRGIYGKEKRNTYDKLTVNMFGTSLIFDNLVSSQLGSSDNALLLGAGFMNKFIIQIDYVNQKLRFLSRKSIDLTHLQNLDMLRQRGSGVPIVKIRLNNEEDVLVVTGYRQ